MKNSLLFLSVLLLTLLSIPAHTFAQDPEQSVLNVGTLTTWVESSGYHRFDVVNNLFNGKYPKPLPVGVIHTEGINWGGKVYDGGSQIVRVNGNNFGSGCSPITRLFRVRTDYYKADLKDDAADFYQKNRDEVSDAELQQIKYQYEKDWNEWPADKGAPYYDADKDGTYNPDVDIPGVPGALQTIFINYNDDHTPLYGSEQIGLDIREVLWAYASSGRISSIIYKKVDIIYRGTSASPPASQIDSMYICQWAYTTVGDLDDDFTGTDTTLNLGFTYNAVDPDPDYFEYGLAPPAVGYTIIQGNSGYTGNSSDSAIFNFRWVKGRGYFNRKPLTNSILHRIGGVFSDPEYTYEGALEFYNMMAGYWPYPPYPARRTGGDFIGYGTYMLSGDPVTGTGDVDGIRDGPGHRRMWLMNGPFNMKLGDTAEVVIALVAGMGSDHLSSITALRHNTEGAIQYFNYFAEAMTQGTLEITSPSRPDQSITPENYVLYQNYPNPFNSYTTIRYELPEPAHVTLTIYDVLGREITKLVNEQKAAGEYSVKFNAEGLSSGIYLYRITFDNEYNKQVFDGLTKTMKFILLK